MRGQHSKCQIFFQISQTWGCRSSHRLWPVINMAAVKLTTTQRFLIDQAGCGFWPPLPAITFIPSEGSNTATKLNLHISNFSPLQSKALFTFDFIPLVRVLHKNPFQAIFWNRAPTNSKRYHGPVDFLKAKLQKNEENTWSIFMQMGKRGNVSKQGCGGKATQNMSKFWPFSCLSEPSVWFSLQSSRLYLHTNTKIDKKWHSIERLDATSICKYRRK